MHEAGIAVEILRAAEAALAPRPDLHAVRLYVEVGRLQNVDPPTLRFAFEVLSRDSDRCRGAELVLEDLSPGWRCRTCGRRGDGEGPAACGGCASEEIETLDGMDLLLRSVEAEEAAPARDG